uniref:Hydroxymethylglutaryl-CoA synthase n=1 Tax=Leptocylindrus danicus TaxID=163516 RepID=A0A7S2LNP4_9STRA|mmetsp:Transcript_8043/g.11971  ORF Transcript_8043/g.11971 Transcript_8043/m.11971 type:complete len:1053 (+) Transcript_8043:123-3281(+)|eukprot:CAMPEP_0116042092 /NCGR_PEP_ID=MMETSP0321-20121206/25481_1 /TAXON_ID=163516 /ORGANISM="Leptocylindrus danicus var. danicus, Strain B650" /LENGTH=1052 /DNA_ID=CAMNT_0003522497 /DNA_START=36 /DNA_END=3194 /DNA_ORIENTATION=+
MSGAENKNVGILAIEVYTPRTYVSQSKLEEYNGVSSGKYTLGLGQNGLAITGDCEDINSLALTVVHSLLEKYEIDPSEVGRLEIGTETLVDKSKSTKTILMDLFAPNTDIEGATIVNACYGGTSALLNAFSWVESDGWDGRFAIVVAADIAAYARGPARPTCGVGAVAVLIGRDAPLQFNPREKATHAANVWDFYKPDHTVEYPTVDGALSQTCYYQALEGCYLRLANKIDAISNATGDDASASFDAESADYLVFHAPYNKLVQKSYARLYFLDARRRAEKKYSSTTNDNDDTNNPLAEWVSKPIHETYTDRALDSALKKLSTTSFKARLADANAASKEIGNTYTASVFVGLASLIDRVGGRGELSVGKNVVVFSYGSGALATMYRLHVRDPTQSRFTIAKMAKTLSLTARLAQREEVDPCELDHALETRARMHHAGPNYIPLYPPERLFPGTYYLNGIGSNWVRTYSRLPLSTNSDINQIMERGETTTFQPLAPALVLQMAKRDEVSTPVTGRLRVLSKSDLDAVEMLNEANNRIACVISGVAAGLPGKSGTAVFNEDNLNRLVSGEQCITPINTGAKSTMLDMNVVQLKKHKDGTIERYPVNEEAKLIQLAAQLGHLSLVDAYGVPPGLAQTMDVAAQIAVAAGLEALKSAGLVTGRTNDPLEWRLKEEHRDTTGVVYCSSFPAMDAAVGEVMRFLESQTVEAATIHSLIAALRSRMVRFSGELSEEDEAALANLASRAPDNGEQASKKYNFDRKFLFRVLVLGNAQLAQLSGCRGPNTQTNAACAGTTQAIGMAQDMLISGRAERVVVVAGDNASGETLLPWLGSGFRALGAATTKAAVEDAALPFDKRRSGMILGAGGIGMVLETESSANARLTATADFSIKARLVATQYSNSAYHGAALDRKHIGSELQRFLTEVEFVHGISKSDIAANGVYFSHETFTHASDAASCAGNEVAALRTAFGDELLSKLMILNTKGFTGHPMGVSFEDVTAVQVLLSQTVPPIANYKEKDDYLGELKLSSGGSYPCRYALRFAAGFGSQVAFALYATAD